MSEHTGLFFYIFDSETSGLMPAAHDLLDISLIRCSDRVQFTRQIKALRPKNASVDALRITGKSMDDLYKGIGQSQAINEVNEFLNRDGLTPAHRCIVAHNEKFDRKFVHHMWKSHNQDFQADLWLDTIPMCKRLATKMGSPKASVKLENALDLFGIKKLAGLHTAKGDTRNTYYLWQHLLESGIEYLDLVKQFPLRKVQETSQEEMDDLMAED